MNELIFLRVVVAITMLGTASYCDLKSREVNDAVWIIFGTIGMFFYLFDASISLITFVWIGLGSLVSIVSWRLRLCGGADMLSIVSLSVVIPSYNNIPVSILVLLTSFVTSSTYAIINNVYKNTKSLISDGHLFAEINEPRYKKMIAFFMIHRRSKNEKHVFAAESITGGMRRFAFMHDPDTDRFENVRYVTSALPLMPFLLSGLVFFLIVISLFTK